MSTHILAHDRTVADHPLLIIERILRDREGVWQQIKTEHDLATLIGQMLVSSTLALACFGAVLGASSGLWQAISSALKLPILFLLTLAICLPTLYLFNLVFGARLSVRQALALILVAITVTSVLTLAFAPISLFFLLSAPNYSFFKILNVSILTLTGFVGLSFLLGGMRTMNLLALTTRPVEPDEVLAGEAPAEQDLEPIGLSASRPVPARKPTAPAERPVSMGLLNIWIVLYGFVGTQLAWTLRPFFGDPDKAFEIFRPLGRNFYVNVLKTIIELFR